MDKILNLDKVTTAMDQAGISPANVAEKLDVSREAVSKWLSGRSLPRPDKLLRLALTLDLKLDDLVIRAEDPAEPVIAFRKRGASKTTAAHIARAKDMGRMLSELVPYLPYDLLVQPATLKNPSTDYAYIQQVASRIRTEIGVMPDDELSFNHLIRQFNDLQAVIVPVLWGRKDSHENALHIYLPESMTTWVYLNLDVEVHDFKFWMSHELGHVYTPDLRGKEAEDFADALAGALIFPEALAIQAYKDVRAARSAKTRLAKIREIADCYSISMISVFYEINKYAEHHGLARIELDNGALFGANTNFNKQYFTVSRLLFEADVPEPKQYIVSASEHFNSPIFDALKAYLLDQDGTAGYVQSILNTPLLDAKGIHAELT
jgi:transcriptional regulator with XRE-family HTH domain